MPVLNPKSGMSITGKISDRTPDFTGRAWVFEAIRQWLSAPNPSRYFLLTGEPGVGKTAISDRLSQFAHSPAPLHPTLLPGFLSAVHGCSARDSTTVDPKSFARSIALQLAQQIPPFAQALKDSGEKQVNIHVDLSIETANDSTIQAIVIQNLNLAGVMTAQEAFNGVVLQPLHTLYQTGFDQPITILVDALDEALTHSGDRTIVDLLANLEGLPPQVRFILTSRKVPQVENKFRNTEELNLSAPEFDIHNQADIRAYIQTRISQIPPLSTHLSNLEPQLREFVIDQITQKSDGNFLYVRFLLDAIERGERSLTDLEGLPEGLDGLYYESLERVVKLCKQDWHTTYALIIGILSVARTSLTLSHIQSFTRQSESTLWKCLGDLREFLEELEPQSTSDPEISYSLYHQSLMDFLRKRSFKLGNNTRHNPYYLPAQESHQRIVDYYNRYEQSWQTLLIEDTYCWHYFAYHLCESEQISQLYSLLCNFNWLQSKLNATTADSLSLDYNLLQSDENLHLVQRAIQMSMHTLNQDKTQLAGQLLGRLLFSEHPDIQSLLEQAKQWKGASWLRPFISSLTTPNTALLRTLIGHSDYIRALVVMPDGKQAVSSSNDGTLKVWDIETGETLCTLQEQSGRVDALAVMPNGEQVLAAVGDGSLKIWDLKTGNILHSLQTYHTRPINAVAVTPDEQLAVSASSDGTLEIWNLARGELLEILKGHTQWVETVAITSKGDQVISGAADNLLQVWDLKSNEEPLTLRGHDHWIRAAVVIPGSQRAISASADQTLKVWDLETGEVLHTLQGHTRSVNSVAVIDQQRVISASDDHTLRIWDIETGTTLNILTGHTGDVRAVAVTPDGRKAISAAIDNTLKVWNLDSVDKQDDIQPEIMPLVTVVILPDGDRALSTISNLSKTRLNIWSLHDGAECHSLEKYGWSSSAFAVMPDGQKILAASSHQVNTMLQTMSLNEVFANVSKDALKFWDLKTGKELSTLADPAGGIQAIAVTPDGQIAVTASRDNTLRVWDLDNETELRILRNQEFWRIHTMAVTPDKRLVISAGSLENDLRVWDLQDGREIMVLKGHTDYVYEVASLPQQRAISASKDHTLKIWNLESAEALCTLTGHSHGVTAVAATPNGQRAVSVSDDCSLKVWDLENEKLIASFVVEVPLVDCAIAPNGKFIIAGDTSTRIHVLRLEDGL